MFSITRIRERFKANILMISGKIFAHPTIPDIGASVWIALLVFW